MSCQGDKDLVIWSGGTTEDDLEKKYIVKNCYFEVTRRIVQSVQF